MVRILVIVFFIVTGFVFSQVTYMEEAPEKWSKPELVEILLQFSDNLKMPYIRADGQQFVFFGQWLSSTHMSDTGWTYPYSFNDNINKNLAEDPVISPDGKRMFFTWFTSTWQVYYSDWDEQLQDWGTAVNAGENVNGLVGGARAGCAPNDSLFCFFLGSTLYFARWDSALGKYVDGKKFPDGSISSVSSWWGADMTIDLKNVYVCKQLEDTLNDGTTYFDRDLTVYYSDSVGILAYGIKNKLNISNITDSLYRIGEYINTYETSPTVTGDGRHLYFLGNYHGYYAIYHSELLVDRYGNPVTKVKDEKNVKVHNHYLEQNYPNPFNPATNISFSLPVTAKVTLEIFNALGQKVSTLANGDMQAGIHTVNFDAASLASGIYFYTLSAEGLDGSSFIDTKKMILLK